MTMPTPPMSRIAQLPPIDLLVSDVDGTLLRPDKTLAPATEAAIARLRAAGIRFTLVSSRPPRGMRGLVEQLGIDLPTAAFNGAAIVAPDGSIAQSRHLSRQAAAHTLALFAGTGVDTWVFADGQWLLRRTDGPYVPHELHTLGYGPLVVDSFDGYLGRVDKIVAADADAGLLARLEAQLQAQLGADVGALRSQTYYLDVTHPDANKGNAVAALAAGIGVPLARTAVIGDGANDVPMFGRAGLSIVMGQAEPEVRRHAAHVTASNADDGVAQAIDRLLRPACG